MKRKKLFKKYVINYAHNLLYIKSFTVTIKAAKESYTVLESYTDLMIVLNTELRRAFINNNFYTSQIKLHNQSLVTISSLSPYSNTRACFKGEID